MNPRICPKCGTPQAWEMWRHCHCGYDFGPPRPGYSMEPVREPSASEKVLSISDWESPEHAVRAIRRDMIASWVVLPLLIIALGISRSLTSGDMRDLSYLIIMPSILLARWLLRRNVPASTWETKVNPWVLALGFASAIGLLAAAIVNNSRMMAIAASGTGVVILYIFARAVAEEARIFRDPLRFLAPQEEDGLAEKPAATASRSQGKDGVSG